MADLRHWARSVSPGGDTSLLMGEMESVLLDDHPQQRDAIVGFLTEAMTEMEASRRSRGINGLGPAWRGHGFAPLAWTQVCEGMALLAIILGFSIQFGSLIDPVVALLGTPLTVVVLAVVGSISAWVTELLRVKDKAVGNDPFALHIVYAVLTAATAALGWAQLGAGTVSAHENAVLWPLVLVACVLSNVVLTVVGDRNQKRLVCAFQDIQRTWDQAVHRSEEPNARIFERAQHRSVASLEGIPAATRRKLLAKRKRTVTLLRRRGAVDEVIAAVVSQSPLGCARISVERACEEGWREQPAP